jgi:ubiquinone/menaquinone biosynthesis C-methylase UbiE
MSEHDKGQVARSAAEIYEEFFIPALFIDWPRHVLAAAEVGPGHRVLDVACGTGVLAREALRLVGDAGEVVGIDVNDGMLAVARSQSEAVRWEKAPAESLPFDAESFDRVVSQFGLMFFEDRVKAISEMLRVVRPGGLVSVAVWASLEATPGYAAVAELLHELFGPEVARAIEAPYCLGDTSMLEALFADGGADNIEIRTVDGKARFASVESWIYTDIKGWTLAEVIDDEGYLRLRQRAPGSLSGFVLPDGSVEFAAPAHIVTVSV